MKITIVGAGRVGVHLAKYFSDAQQDVFLVDKKQENLSVLESDFNLRTFLGDPTDFTTLRKANSEKSDIFVAVTANTSENLVACAMAKSMGVKKTIARVDKYDFMEGGNQQVMKSMGVDHVVFPSYLAAESVVSSLEHPWCSGWNEFDKGAIVMVAVRIDDRSPLTGHYLKELYSESRYMHVSALKRQHRLLIPGGDDRMESGDTLYITTVQEGIERVKSLSGKETSPIKNVIIMGGSAVSEHIVRLGSGKFSFVVVDKNIDRCRELSEKYSECEVIYGDASDPDVMDEAGLSKSDSFVALSDNSESNILACLAAKDSGITSTIAEVEKEQFIGKAESFDIGGIINKPMITANAIFQLILDSTAETSKCFAMSDADVARLEIRSGSFLTSARVKDLKLPRELTFAGVIRDGEGAIVNGMTHFKEGDSVIVFCLNGSLNRVEKLFRK